MARSCRFSQDSRGAISIFLALSLVALVTAAGMGIDAARLFKAREALQTAADGAALAVSADSITNSNLIADLAMKYLSTNSPPAAMVTIDTVSASFNAASKSVTVTVSGSAPTTFMAAAGFADVSMSVTSTARRGDYGPLDLVLALDVTASMNEKINGVEKISTLKTAATSLINTVMKSSSARVGIVPFANYVQIGAGYRNADWIDVDPDISEPWCAWSGSSSYGTCDYEDYPCTIDGVVFTCKRPINCKWTKNTETPEWKCGVTEYKWGGCVMSRMSNGEYLTTITNPSSPRYVGRVTKSASMRPPNSDGGGCSLMAITELTNNKSTVLQAFGWFYPNGETFIPDGLIWSWNMLTKEAPLTSARSQAEMGSLGGKRALVLMTDGFNTRYAGTGGWHFPIAGDPAKQAKADGATREICSRMKAEGITIYTVAFSVADTSIKSILRNCATSAAKFFDAADTAALNESFTKIGAELQRVRLSQ